MSEWIPLPAPYGALSMPEDMDVEGPGVYRLNTIEGIAYVGMAQSLLSRLGDHRRACMLTAVTSGAVYPTATVEAARRLETTLIFLLNPSQNDRRPSPTGPVWAASLGRRRPIHGWSWNPSCGHVCIDGRWLAMQSEAEGCSHGHWAGWFSYVQSHVEGLNSQLAATRDELWRARLERCTHAEVEAEPEGPPDELVAMGCVDCGGDENLERGGGAFVCVDCGSRRRARA